MRILHAGPQTEVGPFLRSRATDRRYRIHVTDEFCALAPNVSLGAGGVRTHQVEFQIRDVALHLREAIDSHMLQHVNLGFANVSSEKEQRALAQGAPVTHTTVEPVTV